MHLLPRFTWLFGADFTMLVLIYQIHCFAPQRKGLQTTLPVAALASEQKVYLVNREGQIWLVMRATILSG